MRDDIKATLGNLVPLAEAATMLQIEVKTLRNWRSKGFCPEWFIKLGGKLFIDLSEVKNKIMAEKEKAKKESRRLGLD